MELAVPPHLRKARRPPAPRCDAGAVQAPQAPQQVTIDVGERRGDLGGLEGKVPFEGSDTAALEVNPANALSGKDSVAVVRLAVKSLAVEVDSVELSQAGIVDSAEEAPGLSPARWCMSRRLRRSSCQP